jgi:hypothetical protein
MKFVELAKGLSINVDEIEAVERKDALNSTIQTHHNVYRVNIPYDTLLQILRGEGGGKQEMLNIMKEAGTFAG